MYLYNISIIVEDSHNDALLTWLKNEWIPSLNLQEIKFLKMINSPHEGQTYCIQLNTPKEELVKDFQETKMVELQNHLGTKHHEKAFVFDSLMQYL